MSCFSKAASGKQIMERVWVKEFFYQMLGMIVNYCLKIATR